MAETQSASIHAFDFLSKPKLEQRSTIVAAGDDRFLKQLVLTQLVAELMDDPDDATILSDFVEWRDVADELSATSLFGGDLRVVVVRGADDFVKNNRPKLEDFVDRGAEDGSSGVLILDVGSWPSNTKLFKLVAKHGVTIECRPPFKGKKSKTVDTAKIARWLEARSKQTHGRTLAGGSAEQIIELAGSELGILEQELAKLALFVESDEKVEPQLVREVVGGWRQESTWELLDATLDGQASLALSRLDQLLMAGEAPHALFGAITWSLRRFAAAVRIIQQQEAQGMRVNMKQALEAAGFNRWQPGGLEKAEKQLRQIGRERGGELFRFLLAADLSLKGSHSTPERARWALEQMIFKLSNSVRPTGTRPKVA